MDTVAAYSALLTQLDASPLWSWDAAPSLWALLREEDPMVITPVVSMPSTGHLVAVARMWREQIGGTVPVDQLCLITEGWEVHSEEDKREVRDLFAITKDGGLTFLRYYRQGHEIQEMDTVESRTDGLAAVREVGAAAWE